MCIVFFSRCHPWHQDLQHGFPFTRNCSPYILKTSLENVCRGSPHFFRPATLFESQNCFPTTTSGRRKGLCNLFSLGFISRTNPNFWCQVPNARFPLWSCLQRGTRHCQLSTMLPNQQVLDVVTTAPRKRLENLPSRCRTWTFWRQNIQNIDTGFNFLSCFMLLKQAAASMSTNSMMKGNIVRFKFWWLAATLSASHDLAHHAALGHTIQQMGKQSDGSLRCKYCPSTASKLKSKPTEGCTHTSLDGREQDSPHSWRPNSHAKTRKVQ